MLDGKHVSQLERLKVSGHRSLFSELATLFCREMPVRLEQLREKITARDAAQVARLAHSMVGSSASIGGRQLQAALRGLELAAEANDWTVLEHHHRAVEQAWSDLVAALNRRLEQKT